MTSQKDSYGDAPDSGIPKPVEGKKPTRSFATTVVDSASGLMRSTLSPNASQVGTTLSQALANGGKAESSSNVASVASSLPQHAETQVRFSVPNRVASGHEPLRSHPRQPDIRREAYEGMTLDQFIHSQSDDTVVPFEEDVNSSKGKQAVYTHIPNFPHTTTQNSAALLEAAWESSFQTQTSNQQSHLDQASAGKDPADGEEVVKLLSDPSFQPQIWSENEFPEEGPYVISQEEEQLARWFTLETQGPSLRQTQLRHAVNAAREERPFEDFASIFDDIEHYHEDVWGYIGPLVEAARAEKRAAPDAPLEDGPAVRRLRMVLAHLEVPAA